LGVRIPLPLPDASLIEWRVFLEDSLDKTMEITAWPEQTKTYIEEVKSEMKRVSWPSWKQVRATTGVVIAAVFLFAIYFFVVDGIVSWLVTAMIHKFSR
jgi:preprotein translocase subunit SecE